MRGESRSAYRLSVVANVGCVLLPFSTPLLFGGYSEGVLGNKEPIFAVLIGLTVGCVAAFQIGFIASALYVKRRRVALGIVALGVVLWNVAAVVLPPWWI